MYLNQIEITKLKNLRLTTTEDEENPNKCMECKQDNLEYCEFANLCNRYGAINRAENMDMLNDLFDTVEHMRRLINIMK